MVLNRHIFGALFSGLTPTIVPCAHCNQSPHYQDTESSGEITNRGTNLEAVISCNYIAFEETIFKCMACGTYFAEREWSPGGSEDAMQTSTYTSFRRLLFLEALMLFNSGIEIMANYEGYEEEYERLKIVVNSEKNELHKFSKEIVNECKRLLEWGPASKTNEYYFEDTKLGEEEVARIMEKFRVGKN